MNLIDAIEQRRSVPSKQLAGPGPDENTLQRLLENAIRVPDHGKLTPWRLVLLRGDARQQFGERLAARALQRNPDLSESKQDKERNRYNHAPLVIVVVSCTREDGKIPVSEQVASANCVAYNLLLGAQGLGFGAQWLTGWAAYDEVVADLLGLGAGEHVVGFVHVGTPQRDIPERDRPALEDVVGEWKP